VHQLVNKSNFDNNALNLQDRNFYSLWTIMAGMHCWIQFPECCCDQISGDPVRLTATGVIALTKITYIENCHVVSLEFVVCYGTCLCACNRPSIAVIVYGLFSNADRLYVLMHWPGRLNVLYTAGAEPEISLGEIGYRVAQKALHSRCVTTEKLRQITSVPFCISARY